MTNTADRQPPSPQPDWLPVANPDVALADDIRQVCPAGRIVIFCGEADPTVYNQPHVLDAFREAHARRAVIGVSTSPIMLVDDHGENGLISLYEEGIIDDLRHRRARYATAHFRVIQTDFVYRYYAEHPHAPLIPQSRRRCVNLERLPLGDIHQLAKQALELFDSWLKDSDTIGTGYPNTLPLLTTSTGLAELISKAGQQGKVFKYLNAAELMSLSADSGLLHQYQARK